MNVLPAHLLWLGSLWSVCSSLCSKASKWTIVFSKSQGVSSKTKTHHESAPEHLSSVSSGKAIVPSMSARSRVRLYGPFD